MILKVSGLNKSFRHPWNLQQIQVLKDVSFEVEKKSIVGFLGGNGAGKTTTMKCLMGLLKYQSGDIKIFGKHHLAKSVKKTIGFLPERPFFYNYLTAEEFLTFYGQLSGMKNKKELNIRIDELLAMVGLSRAKKLYLTQFSKGMLQRIGMAQSLIHRPKLLVLDEPLSGLDPDGRRQLVEIIQTAFQEEETTIFFSSHLLDDIDRLCQNLVVIKSGEVKFSGPKIDFVGKEKLSYLIKFQENSQPVIRQATNLAELQDQIDQLRSEGKSILSVEQERMTLDRAFKEFQMQEHR